MKNISDDFHKNIGKLPQTDTNTDNTQSSKASASYRGQSLSPVDIESDSTNIPSIISHVNDEHTDAHKSHAMPSLASRHVNHNAKEQITESKKYDPNYKKTGLKKYRNLKTENKSLRKKAKTTSMIKTSKLPDDIEHEPLNIPSIKSLNSETDEYIGEHSVALKKFSTDAFNAMKNTRTIEKQGPHIPSLENALKEKDFVMANKLFQRALKNEMENIKDKYNKIRIKTKEKINSTIKNKNINGYTTIDVMSDDVKILDNKINKKAKKSANRSFFYTDNPSSNIKMTRDDLIEHQKIVERFEAILIVVLRELNSNINVQLGIEIIKELDILLEEWIVLPPEDATIQIRDNLKQLINKYKNMSTNYDAKDFLTEYRQLFPIYEFGSLDKTSINKTTANYVGQLSRKIKNVIKFMPS